MYGLKIWSVVEVLAQHKSPGLDPECHINAWQSMPISPALGRVAGESAVQGHLWFP